MKASLLFIFITVFIDVVGFGLVIPTLPKILQAVSGKSFEDASTIFGFMVGIYALMQFLFSPLLGSLSDKFGRRPIILLSLLGLGLDYVLLAFAPNLYWLFAGRILSGILGASYTVATAYIADISPVEKRAENFGILGIAFGIGFIVGPLLGGLLGDYDLRLPFKVAAGLSLLNFLYGVFILPESLKPENRRELDLKTANPFGSFYALFKFPKLGIYILVFFLLCLAHRGLESNWVLYTQFKFNWDAKMVGISLAVVGVGAAIVQGGLIGFSIKKFGENFTLFFGLFCFGTSFVLFGLAFQTWMMLSIIVFNALGGLAEPTLQGILSRSVPDNEQGMLQGSLTSLMSVSGIIAPPILNGLFAHFIRTDVNVQIPGIAFFVCGGLTFISIVILFLHKRSS